jgi:CheY-like chemotaxis protein
MNLCLNSRDAMPGGGELAIETDNVTIDEEGARQSLEARAGEFVRLRVSDSGCGIAAEILPHIFEPFFTTKEPGKGTGLGLAMVFGIVKQHHGWIECYSEVNQGTRFDIFLPRHRVEPPNLPAAAQPSLEISTATETILLVDDEPMLRDLGRRILQRHGYQILLAEDGRQAVEIYRREQQHIDLVILDLTMPHLSGRDALQQLLQINPAVRVVLASGYFSEDLTESGQEGVLSFISKPYRDQDLVNTVRSILEEAKTGGH